ncbi:hypothetical protein COCOBI_05-6940 [Coccomyxa sp. Obi]|nr:hypothetical protein COCOBI_05-6940 [Coccomyxa sp. Obi]
MAGRKLGKISTASFRGERADATVRLPSGFVIKEGAQLAETCFVGMLLGEGIQGVVYDLVDETGKPLNLVLKAVRSGAKAWMSNMLPSMEREWAIGQRLAMHCRTDTGLHPGFMRVGAALIVEEPVRDHRRQGARGEDLEQGKAKPKMQGHFKGMVLQKLSGQTLADILGSKRSGVQDVHYLRAALLQVLTALAEAQKLGFRHWDLRMTNIMEHHSLSEPVPAARTPKEAGSPYAQELTVGVPPASTDPSEAQGISRDSPEVWSAIELTEAGAAPTPNQEQSLRQKNQSRLVKSISTVAGVLSSRASQQGSAAAGTASEEVETVEQKVEGAWKIIDYGHADFGDKTLQYDGIIEGPPFHPDDGLPKWMLESGLPKMPLAEKCYRQFWWRKGDVYRMLMSLQNIIDGSTWPAQDKRRVNELVGLIHHVTGKRITVYFTDEPDQAHQSCGPRFWRRSDGFCHAGRRWQMRVQTFVAPYNPGITATEALSMPFFSRQES